MRYERIGAQGVNLTTLSSHCAPNAFLNAPLSVEFSILHVKYNSMTGKKNQFFDIFQQLSEMYRPDEICGDFNLQVKRFHSLSISFDFISLFENYKPERCQLGRIVAKLEKLITIRVIVFIERILVGKYDRLFVLGKILIDR